LSPNLLDDIAEEEQEAEQLVAVPWSNLLDDIAEEEQEAEQLLAVPWFPYSSLQNQLKW